MKLRAADLFCGAGGTSIGAHATGGVDLIAAVNHWDRAIETHSANFPATKHFHCGIDKVDPREVDQIDLLFASPECTSFTGARGNRPRSESSRCLAWHVLPWIEHHRPAWFVVENVAEFAKWGPLDSDGKTIKSKLGVTFDAWLMALRSYGYEVEHREMCAADYGAATSRTRLFVIGRRGTKSVVFPEPTHPKHKPFLSVMDRRLKLRGAVSDTRTLCPNTMAALHRGRELFGDSTWIYGYYGNATFTPLSRPLPTITTKDRFAIHDASSGVFAVRMLANHELSAAQGFPSDYVFRGTKTEVTKQIGNSVCPPVAEAITRAILSA